MPSDDLRIVGDSEDETPSAAGLMRCFCRATRLGKGNAGFAQTIAVTTAALCEAAPE